MILPVERSTLRVLRDRPGPLPPPRGAGGSFPASPREQDSPSVSAVGPAGDGALPRHAQPGAIGLGISSRAFRGGFISAKSANRSM